MTTARAAALDDLMSGLEDAPIGPRDRSASDPNGVAMGSERVRVTAGPHKIAAAFVPPAFQGVVQDLISPLKYSLNSTSNAVAYGFSLLPHLRELTVNGPYAVTGVSDTPVRRNIFSCQPATVSAERPCAQSIVNRLGMMAYRRPLTEEDRAGLMSLYDAGRKSTNFETGVRTALEGMLASPDFVFRFEQAPRDVAAGANYKLREIDLASRLSFFLWSAPPDQALLTAASMALGKWEARSYALWSAAILPFFAFDAMAYAGGMLTTAGAVGDAAGNVAFLALSFLAARAPRA
jgi:hypothetical protein